MLWQSRAVPILHNAVQYNLNALVMPILGDAIQVHTNCFNNAMQYNYNLNAKKGCRSTGYMKANSDKDHSWPVKLPSNTHHDCYPLL